MRDEVMVDRRRTVPRPSPELEALLDRWRASQEYQNRSERTISERAAAVVKYAAVSHEPPLQFTAEGMTAWVGRPRLSPATRWTYAQHLRAWHAWLQKQKLRQDNPTIDMDVLKKPVSEPRPIESYQLASVIRVASATEGPARMMVLLAAFAGLRVHEIAKIAGKDLDPVAGTLRVVGKGGKKTTVVLHPSILDEAAKYPRRGWWFPSSGKEDAGPLTRHHVSRLIGDVMDRAGVDATAHALRHTFATNLVNSDVDILTIQKLMRHSSPTSTAIYAEVNRVRRAEAVNRLTIPEPTPPVRRLDS